MDKKDPQDVLDTILAAMEAAEIAWWEMTLPEGSLLFGENKARLLGYEPGIFKHYTDFTKLVDPADYEPMMESMRELLSGEKQVYESLFRITGADGKVRTYYDRGRIVKRENGKIIVTGMTVNTATLQSYAFNVASKPYEPIERT